MLDLYRAAYHGLDFGSVKAFLLFRFFGIVLACGPNPLESLTPTQFDQSRDRTNVEYLRERSYSSRSRQCVPDSQKLAPMFSNMTHRLLLAMLTITWIAVSVGMTINKEKTDPRDDQVEVKLDPNQILGVESCEKCHAAEISVWKQTPHHDTFATLHRKPEAQQIAQKLGIESFKENSACMKCHYTVKQHATGPEAVSGVSCESCHGAAQGWVSVHNDYGGSGATKDAESAEHRIERLRASINGGMRNPVNIYMVAQSCYRCHTVPDERLVNVGGHKEGSMDFEMVSWSQGMVRHNFLRSDGKTNESSSPERLRQLFMAGMIADLEFSLRATAAATEKATFGINSAQRAARAAKRLQAAQGKLNQPLLDEIQAVFSSVKLRLNNSAELIEAADKISGLGVRFAATVKGEDLSAMDSFIPPAERWKNAK
jgi:Cytochrome c554 and c-prime